MRRSSGPSLKALVTLVDHVRTLYFDGVDQDMGLLGALEHCRARLRNIVSELRPWRVIAWFDFWRARATRAAFRDLLLEHLHQQALRSR